MLCAAPVASADQNMYLNELQGKLFVSLTNNQALHLGNAACGAMGSAINSGMSMGNARHQGDLAVANAAQADGDQMYLVGTDIQPGIYKTAGPGSSGVLNSCYWAVLNSLNTLDIADNGNIPGPTTIQVDGKALELNGGCTWARIG